jgi:gluconolactonase
LTDKELFAAVGTDGMSIDGDGNVYITHQKGVEIFSVKGEKLKTFLFDAMTTNVVFDNKVLYATTQHGEVYRVDL